MAALRCLIVLAVSTALVSSSFSAESQSNSTQPQNETQKMDKIVSISGMGYTFYVDRKVLSDSSGNLKSEKFVSGRFRVYLEVEPDKRTKAVFKIETDPEWGSHRQNPLENHKGNDSSGFGAGADNKGEVQIKNAYIQVKLPVIPATVKAGIQGFKTTDGMFFGNDMAGLKVEANLSPKVRAKLFWVKPNEGIKTSDWDDVDIFTAGITFKNQTLQLNPTAGVILKPSNSQTSNSSLADSKAVMPVALLGLKLKLKPVTAELYANAVLGQVKHTDGSKQKVSAVAVKFRPTVEISKNFKLNLTVLYYSGDDNPTNDSITGYGSIVQQKTTGAYGYKDYIFFGQMEPWQNMSSNPLFDSDYGVVSFGIGEKLKLGRLKFGMMAAVFNSAVKNPSTNGRNYGFSIDTITRLKLTKHSDFILTLCYGKLGDFFEKEKRNDGYVSYAGLNFKF